MSEKKILQVGDLIKATGFTFSMEASIELISGPFGAEHRRLRVFHLNGLECSNPACRNVGTRLIQGIDKAGGIHWDVYTDSMILMNVDHIVPKHHGGNNYIKNLQPLCLNCNCLKGDRMITNEELAVLYHENLKRRRGKQKVRELREPC
jgi:5-methylcytosine-specific restriction endonuclease McrA